ncbi:Rv3235 family protein [Streptomyces sp. NBC_00659]|uniref:Rv3235 family protein n=1 Tax=Streptomyces sp. NBC_00659 TaxID=2903669 RepID=UPI002E37B65F|nr:Rv3235 family protein [Streptomyces sp. NBC_00659]
MNKVMTRTRRHPGTRPPGRQDSRRPGGAPPRTPGTGTPARRPGGTPPQDTSPSPTPSAGALPRGEAGALATTAHETPAGPAPRPRPTDVFAERLLAVLSGARPVHCMLRHTAGRAYDELVRLAERGPLRTRGTRPVVRDIGYYVARPGAVEAFARIGAGDQLRAMAFRLEQGPDLRWRCTAIELGGPRTPRPTD